MVAVIAFSLFLDYFLYGLLFPLVAHSPAGLKGEGHLALLYGAYAISVLLVTPVFGYWGDRIGGRSTMLCGAALAICAISLLGAAPSLSLLLLGKFCQGAASAALWTSGLALIATNYVEKRVVMLGYAFTGGTFGSVIGPIAGGLLYHAGGYKLPFLITGVAFAIAASAHRSSCSRRRHTTERAGRLSCFGTQQIADGPCCGYRSSRVFCGNHRTALACAAGAIWRNIDGNRHHLYCLDLGVRLERTPCRPRIGAASYPKSDRAGDDRDGGHRFPSWRSSRE